MIDHTTTHHHIGFSIANEALHQIEMLALRHNNCGVNVGAHTLAGKVLAIIRQSREGFMAVVEGGEICGQGSDDPADVAANKTAEGV
jgi:hypothetical protein